MTITLNPAIDKTVIVPDFAIGGDFCEQSLSFTAGGKGINVSRTLRHFRISTLASGFLGGTAGEYIKLMLMREGIRNDFCFIGGNSRTSLTVIDPVGNAITRVIERGPRINQRERQVFLNKFASLIKGCLLVIFSGRSIPGAEDSFYAKLIMAAKKQNKPAGLDTSGKALKLGLSAKPYLIKPNLMEAEQLLERRLDTFRKRKAGVVALRKMGVQVVALTLGAEGAIVFDGKTMVVSHPPRFKPLSPVGCGDAFMAGFFTSLTRGKKIPESVRFAVACGTASSLNLKPGFITNAVLKTIYRKIKLETTGYSGSGWPR